jgi:hypothetical protein
MLLCNWEEDGGGCLCWSDLPGFTCLPHPPPRPVSARKTSLGLLLFMYFWSPFHANPGGATVWLVGFVDGGLHILVIHTPKISPEA